MTESDGARNQILSAAVAHSKVKVLEWAWARWVKDPAFTDALQLWLLTTAAHLGKIEVLEWARAKGFNIQLPVLTKVAADAAELRVLKWAHENGIPWRKHTLSTTPWHEHLPPPHPVA